MDSLTESEVNMGASGPGALQNDGLPVFTAEDRPRAIVDGAGRWLAAVFGPPFRWSASKRSLHGADGHRSVDIHLQGSRHSRAGESTVVSIWVYVDDEKLAEWRRQHPDLCHHDNARLFAASLADLAPGTAMVEIYGRLHEVVSGIIPFADVPELLREEVLPVLSLFGSPADVVQDLPNRWWTGPINLVEWSVSRGEYAIARQVIVRYLTLHPSAVPLFQAGLKDIDGGLRRQLWSESVALGRSAAILGLFTPDDPIPVAPPPAPRRTFMQRLRARRGYIGE